MSNLLKKFKAFYNKDDMDYAHGDVDPFEFYVNFYYFARAFQVMDNEAKPKWTYISGLFVGTIASLAVLFSMTSVYHGVQEFDVSYTTEFGTYFIIMSYELLILSSVKLNLCHYHRLLREVREDFRYVYNEGAKYRARFFENHLLTWKASLLAAIFTAATGVGMIMFVFVTLIYYIKTHEPEDRGNRPLPFQFWISGIDFGQSPMYEILFVFGCLCMVSHTLMYLFTLQTNIIWVRLITSKADIVIWSLQDLLVDIQPVISKDEEFRLTFVLKDRMRDILIKHLSMYSLLEDYAGVYKKFLMYEQKLSAPVICLTAYCTAEKLDHGETDVISILLFISVFVVVLIPSYLCTFLADKIKSVGDACWDIPFWKAGPLMKILRPYLVLIMQKSQRPLVLQAAGFKDMSIETFSNNIASAYSWFNILRQSNL